MANPPEKPIEFFKLLFTHEGRNSMKEARNVLLVVATLIAAVTFQAGVSPPGGVWQETTGPCDSPLPASAPPAESSWSPPNLASAPSPSDSSSCRIAGQAIYASRKVPFYVFLVCNTLALWSSINLIIALTWGFPFFLEVVLATVSMGVTYGSAIFAVTPYSDPLFRWLLFTGLAPFLLRLLIQIGKYYVGHMSKRS